MSAYVKGEDLIRVGAYKQGTDPELDRAVALRPQFRLLLTQGMFERSTMEQAIALLMALPEMA